LDDQISNHVDDRRHASHVVDSLVETPTEPNRQVSTDGRTTIMVAVGDQFPAVVAQSHEPSWPTPVKMQERLKGKKTLVVGLPGAFTPT
jgi:hypothetical protein